MLRSSLPLVVIALLGTSARAQIVQNCRPGVDALIIACPCANPPAGGGFGCDNFGAGPVQSGTLDAIGAPSLAADTVVLNATGENFSSFTVFFTGMAPLHSTGVVTGAGVRCVTGSLRRLWFASPGSNAVGGAVSKPSGFDLPVSLETQAAYSGVPILPGETRHYMCIYRDPGAAAPCGNTAVTINITNSVSITWF